MTIPYRLTTLLLLGCLACGANDPAATKKGEQAATGSATAAAVAEVVPIEVAAITTGTISRSLSGSGTLRGQSEVDVAAERGGLVVELQVDSGYWVERGALLARLDDAELRNALADAELALADAEGRSALSEIALEEQQQSVSRAQLNERSAEIGKTKAELANAEARNDYERKRTLRDKGEGIISDGEFERARLALDQSLQDVTRAEVSWELSKLDTTSARTKLRELERRRLDAAREVEKVRLGVVRARLELAKCSVTAPIGGLITSCPLELGSRVNAGTTCFTIVDPRRFYLDLRLPEAELGVLREGQPVRLESGASRRAIAGRVARLDPAVDPRTGTIGVRIVVPDLDAPSPVALLQALIATSLRRGMFVRAQIIVATHHEALLVPQRALVFSGQQAAVFVVNAGKAQRVLVSLGFSRDDVVEVLQGDLVAGTEVIVAGQRLVEQGTAVRVVGRS
jgi:RND family efflux transporter MFP subunit